MSLTYKNERAKLRFCLLILLAFIIFAGISLGNFVQADNVATSTLQAAINQRNLDIQALQKEISGYQSQIDSLGSQSSSLAQTMKSLSLTKLQLETRIKVLEDQIIAKNLEIKQFGFQINDKQENITDDERYVGQSFAVIGQINDLSPVEILLGSKSLSSAFDNLNQVSVVQNNLLDRISALKNDKSSLESNKHSSETAKADLIDLQKDVANQRKIVLDTISQQNTLMKETNQNEATYRRIIADKQAQQAAMEQELMNYESQLHLNISSSEIPKAGTGVLSWPVDVVHITQYFGNTSFSSANPQVYNGRGHNGVDFRAAIGTRIKAALGGEVVGMGNTDLFRGCYSYGRWVMIKHPNGMSTLYGHLSLQVVNVGDQVTTGQVIGYSGNTGYTTGPHLHFGVYLTKGVQIRLFSSSRNCKGAIIPVADYSAYLNPLSYLQ